MIIEGGTWTEEIILGSEDNCGILFFSGFHPRNGKVSGMHTIVKFAEGDWGRMEDMVFAIKGGGNEHSPPPL